MESLTVKSYPATQILAAGDPVTLIQNGDISNTIYLGSDRSVSVGNTAVNVPLSPQSFVVLDGTTDVWGVVNSGLTATVYKIPGGLSFFQSGITGAQFIVNSKGIFVYSSAPPALGNLSASIVPGSSTVLDNVGNTAEPGITTYDNTGQYVQMFNDLLQIFETGTITKSIVQAHGSPASKLDLFSGTDATNTDVGYLVLVAQPHVSADGPFGYATISPLFATRPGQALFAVPEIWHSLGAITATGYTLAVGNYRLSPDAYDFVQFDIQLTANAGGGTAGTYTFANSLGIGPPSYRPLRTQSLDMSVSSTLVAGAVFPRVNVTTAGAVSISVGAYAAGTVLTCSARMSLS